MPEISLALKGNGYDIPTVLSLPVKNGRFPAVILCHGTGSCKNEAGNMFFRLAKRLAGCRIASCRFDFAGCGDSRADPEMLTFYLGAWRNFWEMTLPPCLPPSAGREPVTTASACSKNGF